MGLFIHVNRNFISLLSKCVFATDKES